MKQQHKIWQNAWRQIMGKALSVDVAPDCDFDLHFDIWEVKKDKFFKLFEGFPKGSMLAERAYQLKWGNSSELNRPLTDAELFEQTKISIETLQKIRPSRELNDPQITLKKGDNALRRTLLSNTDPISIEVDDEFSTLVKKASGEIGYNAYFFLKEHMYRLSSSYIPCNWVLWILTDYQRLNPYAPLLRLEYNACDVVLTNNGVLIYQLIDEKRNTSN